MARKPSIAKMTNGELLDALSSYQYHAGDDFSVYPISESDHRRGEKMRAEVLRRMNGAVGSVKDL